MCVTDPWAHMSLVHSILSLKLGVTCFYEVDSQPIALVPRRWPDSRGIGFHQVCRLGSVGIFPHVPAHTCWLGVALSSSFQRLMAVGSESTLARRKLPQLLAIVLWRSLEWQLGGTYVLLCPWLSWPTHGLPWPVDGAFPPRHQANNHWRDIARHSEHASPAHPVVSKSGRPHHQHLATPAARERELELLVPKAQLRPAILIDCSNTKLGGGGSPVI